MRHNNLTKLQMSQYTYDLQKIINMLSSNDRYLKQFMTSPITFENSLLSDRELEYLAENVSMTYGSNMFSVLLGSLCILASKDFRPVKHEMLTFQVASVNGAFTIYDSSTQSVFMKVALLNSDSLEVEAVALRVIKDYVPKNLQRFFLTYSASCSTLIYRDPLSNLTTLDVNRYLSADHYYSFFGELACNMPNTTIAPTVCTNVVDSGISLAQIIECWSSIIPSDSRINQLKNSMRLFHRSAVFDRAHSLVVLDEKMATAVWKRLNDKLNELFSGLLQACIPLKFTHGDLHAGNILYNATIDNFVMIDYGRTCIDLDNIAFTRNEVIDECAKIRSKNIIYTKDIDNPNDFYQVYQNFGARSAFDDSKLTHYGILLDIAPLAYYVIYSLKSRLKLSDHPILMYSVMANTIMVPAWNDQVKYFENVNQTTTVFEMCLAFFSLVLRAAQLAKVLNVNISDTDYNSSFMVEHSQVCNRRGIFYTYGQPNVNAYNRYKSQLEELTTKVNFFPKFKSIYNKKVIVGGSDAKFDKTMLTELTFANYMYNMTKNVTMSITSEQNCSSTVSDFIPFTFSMQKQKTVLIK